MQKSSWRVESPCTAWCFFSLQKCGGGWLGRSKPASSRILMIMVVVPQRKLSLESINLLTPLPSSSSSLASLLSKKILQIAMLAAPSPFEVSPPTVIKRSKPHPCCIAVAVLNSLLWSFLEFLNPDTFTSRAYGARVVIRLIEYTPLSLKYHHNPSQEAEK